VRGNINERTGKASEADNRLRYYSEPQGEGGGRRLHRRPLSLGKERGGTGVFV